MKLFFACRWKTNNPTSWLHSSWWAWPGLPKLSKRTILQNLYNISRRKWRIKLISSRSWASQSSINWYYHFWWLWPGIYEVLKITSGKCAVPLQYLKKEVSYEVNVLHANKHESFLQVDSIIFDGFGQACPSYPGAFARSLWHLKEEVRKEVRDLDALVGSNTTLTICYASNVLPPLTLFLSQYGIHSKPFFHLINCVT